MLGVIFIQFIARFQARVGTIQPGHWDGRSVDFHETEDGQIE
jgi:hypothetical protein